MHGLSGRMLAASFVSAAAAEVNGVLLRLLTRLGGGHVLSYRYPAIVAGVGVILFLSGWVRWWCGKVLHVNSSDLLAGSRGVAAPAGPFFQRRHSINRLNLEVNTLLCYLC